MKYFFKNFSYKLSKLKYTLFLAFSLCKNKTFEFYYVPKKVVFIKKIKFYCFLIKKKRFLKYCFFSTIILFKIKLFNWFLILNSLKLKIKMVNFLKMYIYLKLFISYLFQFLSGCFIILKQLYEEIVRFLFTINFHLLFKKFKNWVYEDVYKVLERYLFIYVFSKYKKSIKKKPKKMSVLYFYWLEYSVFVYIGVIVMIFYVIYIFQFEIIFYYFPDVFILRLNELMLEPQLNFSNTNSFIVDSYINPQLERKQLNISSVVGGSSYLFFKYRRFIRGIHYVQSHETVVPFWTLFPHLPHLWDPKKHRLPESNSQGYRAMLKDETSFLRRPFPDIWYRTYLGFLRESYLKTRTTFRAPIRIDGVYTTTWKYVFARYRKEKKTNPHMLASVPLLKIKSTPFFYINMYNLTEQKKYKQKLLYRQFISKLASSSNNIELPYNIDGHNLMRLLAHQTQKTTIDEIRNFEDYISKSWTKIEKIKFDQDELRAPLKNAFNFSDSVFTNLTIPTLVAYFKNLHGWWGVVNSFVSPPKNPQDVNDWSRPLHLNDIMYAHLERYMYNNITHYNYKKWNEKRQMSYRFALLFGWPKSFIRPAEYIKNLLYLPYIEQEKIVSDPFCYNNLHLKYSKNLTGWFRRYASRLYEKHYLTRVPPYRSLMRMDFEKKGVFFSQDRNYRMFLNHHLHQEPSGIDTNKQKFHHRDYPREGLRSIGFYRKNATEGKKRFRNAFFMDDEFLILNTFRPSRYFKVKKFYYDNFQSFVNFAMTSRYTIDSPSRESFWKRFFSRYNYKKKDYYLYYGKRLYDFDKYNVDFNRRYGDIVFLIPERFFSFMSSIFYHIKRREVFFLAKPYGNKKKIEQVEVNDFILMKSKMFFKNLFIGFYGIISTIMKRVFSFFYHLFFIFYRSIHNFFYSFFHLSFLLTKIFEFINFLLLCLLKKINNLNIFKPLGLDSIFVNLNIDVKKKKIEYSIVIYIYSFFENSIFYKIYLNTWVSFTKMLNVYYNNITELINNKLFIPIIFQVQSLKKVLFVFLEPLKALFLKKTFSDFPIFMYFLGNIIKALKSILNGILTIFVNIIIIIIEIIINLIVFVMYITPGLRKKRAYMFRKYVYMVLRGDYKIPMYRIKSYLLGFFPLKLQHLKAKIRVYLEEKNLKRMRYKTLMLTNRKNSFIWTPKRRILTSQFVFWVFVYLFFYIWICHMKIRLYLEEVENIETMLFYVTPILLMILGYIFTLVPGPLVDILTIHGYDSFAAYADYIFDAPTGGRPAM